MAVSVVNEYAAISDLVLVILDRKVDFPTDGKPTRAMRASPDLDTSKPCWLGPLEVVGSRSWARKRASLLEVAVRTSEWGTSKWKTVHTLSADRDDSLIMSVAVSHQYSGGLYLLVALFSMKCQ